jgi:hypothetical protein
VSSNHFQANRPVHLARRDVFFERAMELLNIPMQGMDLPARLAHMDLVLSLLKIAQNHAFFGSRTSTFREEHDFLRFLKLISDNVQSLHSMMQQQSQLEGAESFLRQFLGTTAEQSLLPAMQYQRRAEDILQGLWNLLQQAHGPYRALQKRNIDALDDEERGRYRMAYDSFRREVMSQYSIKSNH